MGTKEKTKEFDAVKMMRDIREKISEETQSMTLDCVKKICSAQQYACAIAARVQDFQILYVNYISQLG